MVVVDEHRRNVVEGMIERDWVYSRSCVEHMLLNVLTMVCGGVWSSYAHDDVGRVRMTWEIIIGIWWHYLDLTMTSPKSCKILAWSYHDFLDIILQYFDILSILAYQTWVLPWFWQGLTKSLVKCCPDSSMILLPFSLVLVSACYIYLGRIVISFKSCHHDIIILSDHWFDFVKVVVIKSQEECFKDF